MYVFFFQQNENPAIRIPEHVQMSELPAANTLLKDLERQNVLDIFPGIELKPEYLECAVSIGLDQAVLDFDCEKNKVAVVKKPKLSFSRKRVDI